MDPEEHMPDNIKEQINNLLWVVLPHHATLKQAEDIALDIYHKIVYAWASIQVQEKKEGGQ